MSQLDKEMADILEACLNNPEYLNGTNWMCQVVGTYFIERDLFRCDTHKALSEYIYGSLNNSTFLVAHLLHTGKIKRGTQYAHRAYKEAAHAHWNELILKLRSQP